MRRTIFKQQVPRSHLILFGFATSYARIFNLSTPRRPPRRDQADLQSRAVLQKQGTAFAARDRGSRSARTPSARNRSGTGEAPGAEDFRLNLLGADALGFRQFFGAEAFLRRSDFEIDFLSCREQIRC